MPKAVLLSIKPLYCELIANGEKTIEVRKTRPKLELPFKCYIYCTKYARDPDKLWVLNKQSRQKYRGLTAVCANLEEKPEFHCKANNKVIGEFVCDEIITVDCDSIAPFNKESGEYIDKEICLDRDALWGYTNGKCAYGWHISDLKIYDTPKELGGFTHCGENYHFNPAVTKPPQSWCYVEEV